MRHEGGEVVWFARRPTASADSRSRAFAPTPRQSGATMAVRVLACVVAMTAAVCTAPPSAAAGTDPAPVTFADHVDTSTNASPGEAGNPWGLAVGDVNGDRRADLVVPNLHEDQISVLLGGGSGTTSDGTFTRSATTIPSGPNTGAVALADFNSDGYLDIAAVNGGNNTVSVYLGTGGGAFDSPIAYAVGQQDVFNQSVAVVDLNGDYEADLIVADSDGATVSVLLGDGNGGFGDAAATEVGASPQAVVAEYNSAISRLSIAVAAAGANEVDVVPVNSDGTLGSAASYPVGSRPGSIHVADLNGDDIADLVVGNYGDGTVSVLIGQADGTFAAAANYPSATGSTPEGVTVEDLNGDGFADVAVANGDAASGPSAGVSVLLGDGTGALGASQDFAVGTGPIGIAAADVTGDGYPDLVTANSNDDTVSVLRNTTALSSGGSGGGTGGTGPGCHCLILSLEPTGGGADQLFVENLDSGAGQVLGEGRNPVLSAHGNALAFTRASGTAGTDDLLVATLSTDPASYQAAVTVATVVAHLPAGETGYALAPDGTFVVYVDAAGSVHRFDLTTSADTVLGAVPGGGAAAWLAVDPSDGSVWLGLPAGGLWHLGSDGTATAAAGVDSAQDVEWPSFSADGGAITFVALDATTGTAGHTEVGDLDRYTIATSTLAPVVSHSAHGSGQAEGALPSPSQEVDYQGHTYDAYLSLAGGWRPSFEQVSGDGGESSIGINSLNVSGYTSVKASAGMIGTYSPTPMAVDDAGVQLGPGESATVDVLANDRGTIDPTTLTSDDPRVQVVSQDGRQQLKITQDSSSPQAFQVTYEVCDGPAAGAWGCGHATIPVTLPPSLDPQAVLGMAAEDSGSILGIAHLDTNEFDHVADDDIRGIEPVLSPDGTQVALLVPDDSSPSDYVLSVRGLAGGGRDVAGGLHLAYAQFLDSDQLYQGQLGLAWAPDGKSLYYDDVADGSIHQVDIAPGGTDTKVVGVPQDADGDALAYPVVDPADGSLWVALPDGGATTMEGIVVRPDHAPGIYQVDGDGNLAADPTVAEPAIWPSFSGDGAELAWISNGAGGPSIPGVSNPWLGELRSRPTAGGAGDTVTVDAQQLIPGGQIAHVLPNYIQVRHDTDSGATYLGYLRLRTDGEGAAPAYQRAIIGGARTVALYGQALDDAPSPTIGYFAGEIGGLAPHVFPQDDEALATPGSDVTIDVLANDLGPRAPDTLRLIDSPEGATIVQVDDKPEIQVEFAANRTAPITFDYRVCTTHIGDGRGCAKGSVTVYPAPPTVDLAVEITGNPAIPPDGSSSTLDVTVTNSSAGHLSDVDATIQIPAGYYVDYVAQESPSVRLFDCTWSSGFGITATATATARCAASDLPPGTYTLELKVSGPLVAGHGNVTATVTAPAPGGQTATEHASFAIVTGAPADIAVTQSGGTVLAGNLGLDVGLGVKDGSAPAGSGVAMTFTIPDGASFQAITAGNAAAAATECTAPKVGQAGEIRCWADTAATFEDGDYTGPGINADYAPVWHIVLTPPADASAITLTATGTGDATDPDLTNNTATHTYPLAGTSIGVDLGAAFTGPVSTVTGATMTVHPAVTVPAGATATSVVETITLPAGVAFQSIAAAQTTDMACHTPAVGDSGEITCSASTLTEGVTWNLTVTAPVIPGDATLANAVIATTDDPVADNNTSELAVAVTGPKATPTVALTGPSAPVATGTDVELGVAVAPPAAAPAGGPKPSGTVTLLVDGVASAGPVALDSDGRATFHWMTEALGAHQLSAHYNGDGSYSAADSDTVTITVALPGPDGAPALSHTGAFLAGGTGQYRVTLTNKGTEASAVTEFDLALPVGFTVVGASIAEVGGAPTTPITCVDPAPDTGPVRCTPAAPIALSPGASSAPIMVTVAVASGSAGGDTVATIVMNGDVNADNDSATDPTAVTTDGLTVSLSGPATNTLAGQTVQLGLTVGNVSASDIAGPVTATVMVPNGTPAGQVLTYVPTDAPGWKCRAANLRGVTVITCRTPDSVPAGMKLTPLPITVAIPATAALGTDSIRYGARAAGASSRGTPLALAIGPMRPAHVTATLIGASELSPTGGDYVLDVANNGAGATTGPLTVSLPLPVGVTAAVGVGGPWQCIVGDGSDYGSGGTGSLDCTLNQALFAGGSAPQLPVRLTADPQATNSGGAGGGSAAPTGSMASFVATLRSTDATGVTTGIGAASLRRPLLAAPLLQLTSAQHGVGRYKLTVQNAGVAASSGDVTVSEQLPAGFTAQVDTTRTAWQCAQTGTTLSCTAHSLVIPPGGSASPPDVEVAGPKGLAGTFALSGQVVAAGVHSSATAVSVVLPPPVVVDDSPATAVVLGDSPLYDGEHSTAALQLRANGTLPVGSDVLFALILPPGITVDPDKPIVVGDQVPQPDAGSISFGGIGGSGDFGGGSGGTTSGVTCKATSTGTAVACESTSLQDDSIGSATIPIIVGPHVAGTASFYSGIIPYIGLAYPGLLDYGVSAIATGGVSVIGSLGLTKVDVRQFVADAGAPQTLVASTPGAQGGQVPTVVDLDASGTTEVGHPLTYGWVQTMGPPVVWGRAAGLLTPGTARQPAFPGGATFRGVKAGTVPPGGTATGSGADGTDAQGLPAPDATGAKPHFTAPVITADTVLGFRVYVTDGNTVQTADTTVTLTAVADNPPTGTMTATDMTTGTALADGSATPEVGDQIQVTVTTADVDGDPVQTAVSVLRPANLGTAIAPVPGESAGAERHFTFAWPASAPQLTLQAQLTDGKLAPDGTAVASYATLSVGPPPPPIAVTISGAPTQPAVPGASISLAASVTGIPAGGAAPVVTWSQVSGPAVAPTPAAGSSTTITVPAGVQTGDSIVLEADVVVGSGADAQAVAGQVTVAVGPAPPLAVTVTPSTTPPAGGGHGGTSGSAGGSGVAQAFSAGTVQVSANGVIRLAAAATGGAAPVTYHWIALAGTGTLTDPNSATATYTAAGAAEMAAVKVTATDATGQTAAQIVPLQVGAAPAASTASGTGVCSSSGALGALFSQQAAAASAGHFLLKLGQFTIDLGHLNLAGQSCTPAFSISVGGSPGDNVTATLGPLNFSHIKATLSGTELKIASATVDTPSEWHLGTTTASNLDVKFDPFDITGTINWTDKLPLLSKPGTASAVSTAVVLGKDSLQLTASAGIAGGTVAATGTISTATGDFSLGVTATGVKIFGQAFSGSGAVSDKKGAVTGSVKISWVAGKTADMGGLHLTSASLTWDKNGISVDAAATIAGKFTAALKTNYDDTQNWTATVTGGLAADWTVTPGLTLTKAHTALTGTISDKKNVLTFNVGISIGGSWTAGPVTLTGLNASVANSAAPGKSCGRVPAGDVYLTLGGTATISVGSKSIALTASACIVPDTGDWTIASTATLTNVTLISDLSLTGVSLTVAHSGSQYSAVLVGTVTSHGVTGSVQVALIDGSSGVNFLAAATIDISKLGVSLPGCGALLYSTEAISDLSTVPGLDLGLTSAADGPSAKTTSGGSGGCGAGAGKSGGKKSGGTSGSGSSGSSSGGTGGAATGGSSLDPPGFSSSAAQPFRSAAGRSMVQGKQSQVLRSKATDKKVAGAAVTGIAVTATAVAAARPRDVLSGTCRSAPVDTPDCFGFVSNGASVADTFCTFLPTDFAGVVTIATCPDSNVTPMAVVSSSADACYMATIDDPSCFNVDQSGALCTIDLYHDAAGLGMETMLPNCGQNYLPLGGASQAGPVGLDGSCATADPAEAACFGLVDGLTFCTFYPRNFVGVAWIPTCPMAGARPVTQHDAPGSACVDSPVVDPRCFDVDSGGGFCSIDRYDADGNHALGQYMNPCGDRYRPLGSGSDDGLNHACVTGRVDNGSCFGFQSLYDENEPDSATKWALCTNMPDEFTGIAWLPTCSYDRSVPFDQQDDLTDVCAMSKANNSACFDVNPDGSYCTIDSYRSSDGGQSMFAVLPTCAAGARPLIGAPSTGAGGVIGCDSEASVNSPTCFGYTSAARGPGSFCTYDATAFVGIVVIQPCPQTGSVPVDGISDPTDRCFAALLSDFTCFGQQPDQRLCSTDTYDGGGGVVGPAVTAYLDACGQDATAIVFPDESDGSGSSGTGSGGGGVIDDNTPEAPPLSGDGADSGPGSGPGNTGATGATNNPLKSLGIPSGFTVMAAFALPQGMKDFLGDKLNMPKPILDSDLIVQANLSGTPVIKATLAIGDGGIVMMHNDSNGTKLTLQSISLTISLGGSFGLAATGGLDLPKTDAKGPADVAHLDVTAAVSIQVSGVPSVTLALSKTGDVWDDAFGVAGLDLGDIAIQGGIVFSTPPTPSIGFGANIVSLPEPWRKPLGIQDNPDGTMEPITFVINISAANPILQISLGVPDGHTFLEPMQPIASILPLSDGTKQQLSQVLQVDDASLIIAPYGGSVGPFVYTPGFHVRFDATMLGVNVNVKADVGISPPMIDAHVDVGAFGFGGLSMDETKLDLSITPTTGFSAHFSGGLSIGGASTTATLDAKANLTGGMTFDFESNLSHIGYGSMLSLDNLDIFGHGAFTSLKQVPSVTFGMTATAHVLGAGLTTYGDVELGPLGIQGFDIVAAPHPVSLGGVLSLAGHGCDAAALAGLPDVPALPIDGPCFQIGYHPLQSIMPTIDINAAIHTAADIDVDASLTLDSTGLAASGSVKLGPIADVAVAGNVYFGSGLAGVTACDESSVLSPGAPCHRVAVHQGDFVFSAAVAGQVSLAGMSANLFAGIGHVGSHDWLVGRAALGILDTPSSPIHGNAEVSGAFYHNGTGFHFDLSGSGAVTLGGSVTSSGHIAGGYSLASATFEVSSDACSTLTIPGLTQLAGATVSGCAGFTGSLGQVGGPLPVVQVSGVLAPISGVTRFQFAGRVDVPVAGFTLASAAVTVGNMSGPVVATIAAHTGLGDVVTVDASATVASSGDFCITGTANVAGSNGGASVCTAHEPNPGIKVWFTTYGFSVSGYIGPGTFALQANVHLNPQVSGTFLGIALSAYADFTVSVGVFHDYTVNLPPFGSSTLNGLYLNADGSIGVHACKGTICIGPSLGVAIQYHPGFGICVGTSIVVTDIKVCYDTTSGLQVVDP